MVSDDDIHAELPRASDWLDVGDAGVHGNHECDTALRKLLDALHIHAVPFKVAVWDVVLKVCANFFQKIMHDDSARPSIAVVVAPNGDMLPARDGARESLGGSGHTGYQKRVVQVEVVGGLEESRGLPSRRNAAPREE